MLAVLNFGFSKEIDQFSEGLPAWVWVTVIVLGITFWTFAIRHDFRRGRQRRRERLGLCGRCGYDLRATREHCPECGETPEIHLDKPSRNG